MASYDSPGTSLNGWHPGERAMQHKMGYDKAPGVGEMWRYIYGEMTDQHRKFHTSNLHFLPVVTLDKAGRPWSSILTGEDGTIGWITPAQRAASTLVLRPRVWEGDPFWENTDQFDARDDGEGMLIAGIGVEVSTRRRNKLAGKIKRLERNDESRKIMFDVRVDEATGNCPKYIVIRSLSPHPKTNPTVVYDHSNMSPADRLPSEVISFIQAADTIWLGSAYLVDPSSSDAKLFPSHLGINHRGGRPGWVRVKPSDGRTLVIPDYSGNRFMSSLGNIEYTPLASVLIVDFDTGDVLYLTGDAENLQGQAAEDIMPLHKSLTTLRVTGYRFLKDALPLRQKKDIEPSPYSPAIKLLKEEIELQGAHTTFFEGVGGKLPQAVLQKIDLHSPNIATFTFRSPSLSIQPGQAIILDFKALLGSPQYRHMSEGKPSLVNDDLIRTWTVSSYHPQTRGDAEGPEIQSSFQLTMKEKEGGLVTGALFSIAGGLNASKPHLLADVTPFNIEAGIVGVSGDFYLPLDEVSSETRIQAQQLFWAAGGIGLTPFLVMLRAILTSTSTDARKQSWDIVFALSTREPQVLLPLVERVFNTKPTDSSDSPAHPNVRLHLHLFTRKPVPASLTAQSSFDITTHPERLEERWFVEQKETLEGREAYVCGPAEFENLVVNSLVNAVGLEKGKVRKEGFAY
ncbi:hypothetical protein EST38_g11357 [Candolleomyces aberdarensis]|uniref:FAD-binding FR-type domain-containing protein n=1 Tax=Candolleomyces aberdarensis TaxID=2316362 RepID=A0A4Q2D511_9AGAR|nr:hypothetical protein EST38_g11357 [Candolleomyces aberdarensis]